MLKGQIKEKSIPFAYIDYEQCNPATIKEWGEYIDVRGEKKLIRELIQQGGHNILIEGDKGIGKTLMVESICREWNIALFEFNCGAGMNKGDLIGRPQIDNEGSYFEMGIIPKMFEFANHWKKIVVYADELNVLSHDEQLWFNRPLDKRRSIYANGKLFELDDDVKFTFIATINPITYAGVNTLTESLRSRFIGRVLPYPNNSELERIIDWSGIPDETKSCMLTLCQQIHSLRVKGEVEYVFSPRDIDQFCDIFRTYVNHWENIYPSQNKWKLEDVINNVILIKFSDPTEREQVRIRVNETFGVNI